MPARSVEIAAARTQPSGITGGEFTAGIKRKLPTHLRNPRSEAMSLLQAGKRPITGLAAVVVEDNHIRGAALNGHAEPVTFTISRRETTTAVTTVDRIKAALDQAGDGVTNWTGVATHGLNGSFREHATTSWRFQLPMYSMDGQMQGSDGESADPVAMLKRLQEMHSEFKRPKVTVGGDGRVITSKLATWHEQMAVLPPERAQIYKDTLDNEARVLYEDNVVTVVGNTTAVAGGVAQMNAEALRMATDYNDEIPARRAKGEDVRPIDFRWIVAKSHVDYDIARSLASKFGIEEDIEDPRIQAYFMNKYGDKDEHGKPFINIYRETKDRHNALQDQMQPGYDYTKLDDWYYHAWAKTQARDTYVPVFEKLLAEGKKDVEAGRKPKKIVFKVEDQQMFGVAKALQEYFPKDEHKDQIFYNERLHIHVHADQARVPLDPARDPETPPARIAASVVGDLEGLDAFMSHKSLATNPQEFLFQDESGKVHPTIRDVTVYAGASMDTTTGSRTEMTWDKEVLVQAENLAYLHETGQTAAAQYFDNEAFGTTNRWDRSKMHYVGIQAFAEYVKDQTAKGRGLEDILQYRAVGMAPNDDPESKIIYSAYMLGLHPELINEPEYAEYRQWVDTSNPTMLKPVHEDDLHKLPVDANGNALTDATRFQPDDWKAIQLVNNLVKDNPDLVKKIELYRFDYQRFDDLNRGAVENSRVADIHSSAAEACEDNISGHISQGRFVFVANAGGAPDQVKEGISGHIFRPFDYKDVAQGFSNFDENIYRSPDLFRSFRAGVAANVKEKYTTGHNLVKVLGMSAMLAHEGPGDFKAKVMTFRETHGRYPWVHELLGPYTPPSAELAAHDEQAITHPDKVIYSAPHSKAEANAIYQNRFAKAS